jgi:hypothetical protein
MPPRKRAARKSNYTEDDDDDDFDYEEEEEYEPGQTADSEQVQTRHDESC